MCSSSVLCCESMPAWRRQCVLISVNNVDVRIVLELRAPPPLLRCYCYTPVKLLLSQHAYISTVRTCRSVITIICWQACLKHMNGSRLLSYISISDKYSCFTLKIIGLIQVSNEKVATDLHSEVLDLSVKAPDIRSGAIWPNAKRLRELPPCQLSHSFSTRDCME